MGSKRAPASPVPDSRENRMGGEGGAGGETSRIRNGKRNASQVTCTEHSVQRKIQKQEMKKRGSRKHQFGKERDC